MEKRPAHRLCFDESSRKWGFVPWDFNDVRPMPEGNAELHQAFSQRRTEMELEKFLSVVWKPSQASWKPWEPLKSYTSDVYMNEQMQKLKEPKPLPIDCIGPNGGRALYNVGMGRMMGVCGG